MALEMKVPSPGESITEVEIAEWLVADGDWVEKDQAIAEVDSDKATLELPAEASGIITLKAEEGDAVAVGEVVCLIDTEAENPNKSGSADDKNESDDNEEDAKDAPSTMGKGDEGGGNDPEKELDKKDEKTKDKKDSEKAPQPEQAKETYASGTPSPAAKKVLDEKGIDSKSVKGSGRDGRITKDDAVKAEGKPSCNNLSA